MVVLAGGRATRLGPLASSVPKALQPVGDQTFLDLMLAPVRACGFRRFHFCLGHLAAVICRHLAKMDSADITFSVEHRPQGTAGALLDCMEQLDELFLLLLGDTYLDIDYCAVVDMLPEDALALMVATRAPCGVTPNVLLRKDRVERYDKSGVMNGLTDTGVAVLRRSAFSSLIPVHGPVDLGEVFQSLIAQRKLAGVEIGERFYDIGTPKRSREFAANRARTGARRDQVP